MNYQPVEAELLTQQQELSRRIEAIKSDFQKGRSADFSEQTTESENNEVLIRLKEDAEIELRQVNNALDKIKQGNYGVCETCGEPIAEERLKVLPFASKCIDCAG